MNLLDKIKHELRDRVTKVVANETGLHWQTIAKFKRGDMQDAKIDTIRKLTQYLNLKETIEL